MDISFLICSSAIFLPFLLALFLIATKLNLQYIDKKILNWSTSISNLISLLSFVYLKMFYSNDTIINFNQNIISIGELNLNFGILINKINIDFLIYCALVYFLISIFSIIYFNKKKEFIFKKQGYYIFLLLLSFNTYIFISSYSLIQSLIFWIIQGILVYIFANFDLFKDVANYNTTRFYRIFLIGDILFLTSVLILFKYAILSQGYIQSTSLIYSELNELFSYTYGIANPIEFILCASCFVGAISTRMFVIPFSCFYSFMVNSSNILYLSVATCLNSIFGFVLLYKTMPIFEFLPKSIFYLKILLILSVITSLIFLLYEKNIKIFFGYFISAINVIFIYNYLFCDKTKTLISYAILNILILFLLAFLLYKDKTNLKKHFFIKQKGFLLEKLHIIFFEKIPTITSDILNFIDNKITKNFTLFILKLFDYILSLFVLKNIRNKGLKTFKNIFIIIALVVILTIFVVLFGENNA